MKGKIEVKKLGKEHSCLTDKSQEESSKSEISSQEIIVNEEIDDDNKIKAYIRENPLKGPLLIKDWCKSKKIKATYYKIKNILYDIRQELFPPDKEIALGRPFCVTRGGLGEGFHFCRFRGSFVDNKEGENEVIIFSSPCMLKLLNSANWYIDGTFKIAARGFRQLLIIIIYHPVHKCYLPACFILMSHKSYNCYMFAFRNLQILCSYKELGINMNPVFIMCDFESALRKALNQCFINAKLAGCYFHYCKALWNYVASHSLTTKERLPTSIKLVTFLRFWLISLLKKEWRFLKKFAQRSKNKIQNTKK